MVDMSSYWLPYFSKWVEVASFAKLQDELKHNIICRYGFPHEIICDNDTHFQAECANVLVTYKVQHHKSSPYRPQSNSAVEAANKNIKAILSKMVQTYKDWPQKLHFALWG